MNVDSVAEEKYRISSAGYLERAEALVASISKNSLFYAAFEIRCGIEARMREYLEAREDVSEKKKQGWGVARLGKTIDAVFDSKNGLSDKIVRLQFFDRSSKEILYQLYYTPVSSSLRAIGERLGDYLHAQRDITSMTPEWWQKFGENIELGLAGLRDTNRGTIMGPPMFGPDKRLSLTLSPPPPKPSKMIVGMNLIMNASRHDAFPD